MNEMIKNKLIVKKNRLKLSKNDYLAIFNLDEKLNLAEIKLFTYALYCYDKKNKTSSFSLSEFEEFAEAKIRGEYLGNAIAKVRKAGISFYDESFIGESSKGIFKSFNLVMDIEYNKGQFTVCWNPRYSDYYIGEGYNFTLIDLEVARKLSDKAWILYEYLIITGKENRKVFELTLDELYGIYSIKNKVKYKYQYLKQKYLLPAQEEINKLTDLYIDFSPITQGRRTVGAKIVSAKNSSFEDYITVSQYQTLESMKLQLSKNQDKASSEILNLLSEPKDLTKNQAQKLIPIISKKLRDSNKLAELNTFEENIANIELEDKKFGKMVDDHIKMWVGQPVTKKQRNVLEQLLMCFDDKEDVLYLAVNIALDNHAASFNYVLQILEMWVSEGIKTAYRAKLFHEQKYEKGYPRNQKIEVSDEFAEAAFSIFNSWE